MTTKNTETTHVQQAIDMANAAAETARGIWQQVLDAQVSGFEQAAAQLEELSKRGVTRAQNNLDEVAKLSRSALSWASEMHAEITKAALQAVRSAVANAPKAAA
ncbi:MAG: hypothetical protein CVU56_15180 [Deltaproteobacteria bacterium HGW-Deltaproteobacteria-14]|jgi:6-phosphogluconate dehydrogenase (decarboxylating)|nr:MAG: hypothetical protein CVU56_15180 [Deltaproteobacteria bacterium HGW-Deltaproteobacteria-14]